MDDYFSCRKVATLQQDPLLVRKAFAKFPSGVIVLSAAIGGEKLALVASSFMVGVSLDPCLVSLAVGKSSETWERIKHAPIFGVSIFGNGQNTLPRTLASKDRDRRFEEVAAEVDESGAVFIDDAALWFECSIYNVSEAGDHWMVLLEVHKLGIGQNSPLIWYNSQFHELLT